MLDRWLNLALAQAGGGPGAGAANGPGAGAVSEPPTSLLDFVQAGGTVGYIIILLSLVATTMVVVHFIQIRRDALAPPHVVDELDRLLKGRQVAQALELCRDPANACFLTHIMRSGLTRYTRSAFGALELKSALEEAGQERVAKLIRSTEGLSLVAAIAPMLGLLGTVVGINGAFATISTAEGFSRPDQLAGDISLALVTTIMGLVLAIPAMSAVTFFRNRIDALAASIGSTVSELSMYLEQESGLMPSAQAGAVASAAGAPAGGAGGTPAVGTASVPAGGQGVGQGGRG